MSIKNNKIKQIILICYTATNMKEMYNIYINIGISLSKKRYNIGILDYDIFNNNIIKYFNVKNNINQFTKNIKPYIKHNVKIISIYLLINKNFPILWNSPIIIKFIHRITIYIKWKFLEYLMIHAAINIYDIYINIIRNYKINKIIIIDNKNYFDKNNTYNKINIFNIFKVKIYAIIIKYKKKKKRNQCLNKTIIPIIARITLKYKNINMFSKKISQIRNIQKQYSNIHNKIL